MKRVIAYMLISALCLGILSMSVLAEEDTGLAEQIAAEASGEPETASDETALPAEEVPEEASEEPAEEAAEQSEAGTEEDPAAELPELIADGQADEAPEPAQVDEPALDGSDFGMCGDLVWMLTDDGTLRISGYGAMPDYASASAAPWDDSREQIKAVVVELGVTAIGKYAFSGCSALKTVSVPMSVRRVGARAFQYCTGITSVTYGGTAAQWSDLASRIDSDNNMLKSASRSYEGSASGTCGGDLIWTLMPDGQLIVCGTGAMAEYSAVNAASWSAYVGGIRTVNILPGAQSVGSYAFFGCTALEDVSLPESVTSIGSHAFFGCTALEAPLFPLALETLGEGAFQNCTSFAELTLPAGVDSIGAWAFSGCAGLTYIGIPAGAASVGAYAFEGCTALESVTLPEQMTEIRPNTFRQCAALARVDIPAGVASIGENAFDGCPSLADVYYDGSPTAWGAVSVAAGNGSLAAAQMHYSYLAGGASGALTWTLSGDGVLALTGSGAMEDYASGGAPWSAYRDSITAVSIGAGITAVGENAFAGATALTEISIPAGVTDIGAGAFSGCASLATVELPQSLAQVEASAFSGCTALADVYYTGTVTLWNAVAVASGNEPLTQAALLADEERGGFSYEASSDGMRITLTGEGELAHGSWGRLTGKTVLVDLRVTSLTDAAVEGLQHAAAVLILPTVTAPDCSNQLSLLRGLGLENARVMGDANMDGMTMADDIAAAMRCYGVVTDGAAAALDVDCDGGVSMWDAQYMADFAVGRIEEYPTAGGWW